MKHANCAGFVVARDQKRSENGYCDFLNKKIAVRPDGAAAQAVKTLIHELALLYGDEAPKSRETAEVEVESVAFVVLDAFGMGVTLIRSPMLLAGPAGPRT